MPLQRHRVNRNIEPLWMRLQNLMETQHVKILNREKNNECHAYLYDAGEYYIAFEHSAWQLCRLFPQSEISILYLKAYPFPIVMASVSYQYVQPYFRQHIVRTFKDYTILLTSTIPSDQYCQWHRDVVNG